MRHEALQKGLTMNEHGLYKMEGKKKGEKVDAIFKDEKDIFDYLNLVYKSPVERIDGRAVISKIPSDNTNTVIDTSLPVVIDTPKKIQILKHKNFKKKLPLLEQR